MARSPLNHSRVARMHMRVRAAGVEAGELGSLREQLERRFAVAVLEACEREVHRQLGPDALVFVRRVALRWALRHDELDSPALIDRLGATLADDLVASARTGHAPRPGDSAVSFADRSRYRAAYLHAQLHAGGAESDEVAAWYFAPLRRRDVLDDAAHEGPESVRALVLALVDARALEALVAREPRAVQAKLVAVVPLREWPLAPRSRERVEAWLAAARAERSGESRVDEREPVGSANARGAAQSEPAAEPRSDDASVRERGESSASIEQQLGQQLGADEQREPPTDSPLRSHEPGELAVEREHREAPSPERDGAARAQSEAAERGRELEPTPGAELDGAAPTPEPEPRAWPGCATTWAGLFYLAARVLELDLGSHLWEAGVLEGPFIAALARLLAGSEVADDPAPRVLGFGFTPGEDRLAAIPDWASDEIVAKLERSLAESLARRGLVPRRRDFEDSRLGIHQAPSSLRATDARPGASNHPEGGLGDAGERLEPHERAWLAELTPDAPTARALAAAAAAVRTRMFAGLAQPDELARLRSHLRVPGRLELAPGGTIEVHIAMARVDLELRRAGLDFDPGWLPWLEAKLGFVFDVGRDESW